MKYITTDKLKAEIERRMTENCELGKKAECFSHRAVEDNDILALIDSLQQEHPEVDLEKEIQKYLESKGVGYGGWIDGWKDEDLRAIARYFAEWGAIHLNARKEE